MGNRDYISLGAFPLTENGAQIMNINYHEQSMKECKAYIAQLIRIHGEPPAKTTVVIKGNVHTLGTYHEVICSYDNDMQESKEYALAVEGKLPLYWDVKALRELKLPIGNKALVTAVGD